MTTSILDLAFVFERGLETEALLNLAVGVFALVLFALSITAYKKASLRRLLIVSTAFALFAVKVMIRQLDMFWFLLGFRTEQMVLTGLDFAILLLFFLALVVSK